MYNVDALSINKNKIIKRQYRNLRRIPLQCIEYRT